MNQSNKAGSRTPPWRTRRRYTTFGLSVTAVSRYQFIHDLHSDEFQNLLLTVTLWGIRLDLSNIHFNHSSLRGLCLFHCLWLVSIHIDYCLVVLYHCLCACLCFCLYASPSLSLFTFLKRSHSPGLNSQTFQLFADKHSITFYNNSSAELEPLFQLKRAIHYN